MATKKKLLQISPSGGVVDGVLLHTLNNPNAYSTSADDAFGFSVAISDSYAIVGAYGEDDNSGNASGKAYIFDPSTGALLYTLDNPNPYGTSTSDQFGRYVSISDNYAIASAASEDDAGGNNSGKAYIFNPSTGALLHTLDNPNAYSTSGGDSFGVNVSICDNYAIVGANNEDDVGGTSSGKAYIFDPSTGSLLHTLDNPNAYSTSASDGFGFSVSICDNYAIVGAYGEDDVGGTNSGKAYIFNPSTGALLYTLDNPNAYSTSQSDLFGYAVSISDSYAIVGAYAEDDAGGTNSGKAYIFNPSTGALLYTLDNPNAYSTSASDQFGLSVSISNNYAIVGANSEDDVGGTSSGKAYIFDPSTGSLLYTLDNANAYSTSSGDQFGRSVSISDNYAIVGAWLEDDAIGTNSGKAYIYD
jgi:outer membrane protein assembly factor BamB